MNFANNVQPIGADRSLMVRMLLKKLGIEEYIGSQSGSVTEFSINRPGEHWIEDSNGWHCHENPNLTIADLFGLAQAIAVYNKKKLDADNPIESLTLPDGQRCQIVMPPACEDGKVLFCIRRPNDVRFTLSDYKNSGRLLPKLATNSHDIKPWEEELLAHAKSGNFVEFFELAIHNRLNVVTVGGTGSGKTTFSKALIDLFPSERRIFTAEDAHELTTPNHPNSAHLFFGPNVTAKAVLSSCMRMKPDHIFITELRGDESWDYLMALKSGHSGSVTSIHANDCRGALYKIGSYIKQSQVGQTLEFDYIMREVMTTIDIVVYFEKTHLKELYYDPHTKLKLLRGE